MACKQTGMLPLRFCSSLDAFTEVRAWLPEAPLAAHALFARPRLVLRGSTSAAEEHGRPRPF